MLIAICTLASTEIILRIQEKYFTDPKVAYARSYLRSVKSHIDQLWMSTENPPNPFFPPIKVFADLGSDDPERMAKIFSESRLPPSHTWDTYDFIRVSPSAASTSAYVVHSNSLGFRGPEYSIKKDPSTYRIIVLGSYHAFGLGVNDEDTYPEQLERKLQSLHDGRNYEVWNGGRAAGTAIVGLAQMQHDIFDYKPNLIIIDYGQVDGKVIGDNLFPKTGRFPDDPKWRLFRDLAAPLFSFADSTIVGSDLLKLKYEKNDVVTSGFSKILTQMITIARQHNTPILLVNGLIASPLSTQEFESLGGNGAYTIDMGSIFSSEARELPSGTQWKKEPWRSTFLSELDPSLTSPRVPEFSNAYYKLNVFQLNTFGLALEADALANEIKTNILRTFHTP